MLYKYKQASSTASLKKILNEKSQAMPDRYFTARDIAYYLIKYYQLPMHDNREMQKLLNVVGSNLSHHLWKENNTALAGLQRSLAPIENTETLLESNKIAYGYRIGDVLNSNAHGGVLQMSNKTLSKLNTYEHKPKAKKADLKPKHIEKAPTIMKIAMDAAWNADSIIVEQPAPIRPPNISTNALKNRKNNSFSIILNNLDGCSFDELSEIILEINMIKDGRYQAVVDNLESIRKAVTGISAIQEFQS